MKNIGMVRKIDRLGRIVIAKETRDMFDWKEGTALEMYTEGETVILKEYKPGCSCCKNVKIKATVQGIDLCEDCLNKFAKALELIDGVRTNG